MKKVNINGIEEEISDNVYNEMNSFFNTLEDLRIDLCRKLEIDYLSTNDADIIEAIRKLKVRCECK